MEPQISEADRKAAREWLLPEVDFDAAVYEGAVQSLASVIATHHAAERERSQRIDKALEELLAWLEEDTLAIMKDTTGITFDREDCALLHGKVAEARAALEQK